MSELQRGKYMAAACAASLSHGVLRRLRIAASYRARAAADEIAQWQLFIECQR